MTAMVDASGPANIATFTWQGAARLATTSNQNGTGTDYVYDGFRRTASIDHTLVGGGSLHKFEYAYDKVHNRRMEKNTFSATWIATLPAAVQTFLGGRNGKGDVYAYDMAYRLVDARYDVTNPLTEVQNPGTQAFVTHVAYTIDGLGNRSQVSTTPPTPPTQVLYAVDVVNQYTTVGGSSRAHDSNGNLSDDGTYKFGYDFRNRLVELRNGTTNALIAGYRYDVLGRRVEKAVVGGATTRYVLDGVQVVEEFDGSNVWQARYVYEDGIDQPRCMDRADIADVNGNSNTTEVLRFHYHSQALGSVTELTQPTGAVVEWVTYDVYGLPVIRNQVGTTITQSAVGNPWLYTGREYDPESGLYFYRARTYDPGTGRFLQRDPLGYVDGLSLYGYVGSRPAGSSDPWGTTKFDEALEKVRVAVEEARTAHKLLGEAEKALGDAEIAKTRADEKLASLRKDLEKKKEERDRCDRVSQLDVLNAEIKKMEDDILALEAAANAAATAVGVTEAARDTAKQRADAADAELNKADARLSELWSGVPGREELVPWRSTDGSSPERNLWWSPRARLLFHGSKGGGLHSLRRVRVTFKKGSDKIQKDIVVGYKDTSGNLIVTVQTAKVGKAPSYYQWYEYECNEPVAPPWRLTSTADYKAGDIIKDAKAGVVRSHAQGGFPFPRKP